MTAQVAVIIPGILGSRLSLGDELIWPGPARSLLFKYKKMAELLSDDLEATGVIRSYLGQSQYQSLIEDLYRCGFREADNPPTLVVFSYDWRKSNIRSAKLLSQCLDESLAAHGGHAEFSLIAHSMGGLISRYYLESDHFKETAAFGSVRRLITLGTPHHGAPLALLAAAGKVKRLFLDKEQVQRVANHPSFPSLYELLPPRGEPFAWNEKAGEEFRSVDVFDPALSGSLGLTPPNLEAADAFRSGLDADRRPDHVRYFFFSGTRQRTPTAARLLRSGVSWRIRSEEAEDAGDGTVPSWSSVLPGIQSQAVGGEHGTIFRDRRLRRTLGGLLGKPGVLAAELDTIQLSIRDKVVHPGHDVYLVLTLGKPAMTLKGELRFEEASFSDDGEFESFKSARRRRPVEYRGPLVESIGAVLPAPRQAGLFRISFFKADTEKPAAMEELLVQSASG